MTYIASLALSMAMALSVTAIVPRLGTPLARVATGVLALALAHDHVLDTNRVLLSSLPLSDTEPVVIDRIEPDFDQRTLREGESQRVVLRVLVDQRGRVVRVVVDESESGSDVEFAAINAVLRWTYEPALEAGEPVRSWTSESFEFTRQH